MCVPIPPNSSHDTIPYRSSLVLFSSVSPPSDRTTMAGADLLLQSVGRDVCCTSQPFTACPSGISVPARPPPTPRRSPLALLDSASRRSSFQQAQRTLRPQPSICLSRKHQEPSRSADAHGYPPIGGGEAAAHPARERRIGATSPRAVPHRSPHQAPRVSPARAAQPRDGAAAPVASGAAAPVTRAGACCQKRFDQWSI
jgi:hypothetical protein